MKFGERNHQGVIHKAGRRAGARDKLQTGFLHDLAEAWELEGKGALRIMIREEPAAFVKTVASLMPRELSVDLAGPLSELSDQEVADMLEAVRQLRASTINGKAIAEPVLIEGKNGGQHN
jgi:hypothetical protein